MTIEWNSYTKKPVTIQAIKITEKNAIKVAQSLGFRFLMAPFKMIIPTLEGDMECLIGDFLIKGIKGEYYPCKPDIFDMSYTENKSI